MAEAYERAASDPRLREDKRAEYPQKAKEAREWAQKARAIARSERSSRSCDPIGQSGALGAMTRIRGR